MSPQMPRVPRVPLNPRELGELAQLLFEWPIKQAPRLALPLFILLAAIMQASVIILFSIAYEDPAEKLPTAPQVYFLPPDSAAARQLGPWLEANDPAVFSPLHAARDAFPSPPPLKYRPSYEDAPPPLRPLPAETPEVVQPPMIPTVGVLRRQQIGASTSTNQLPPTGIAVGSTLCWQDELAERKPLATPPVAAMPPAGPQGARPPLFQVSVSPEGLPSQCVLIASSGDPASDEAARIWILAQRFEPAASSSWGRVMLLWDDIPRVAVPSASSTP